MTKVLTLLLATTAAFGCELEDDLCSSGFVSEYNSLVLETRALSDVSDLHALRDRVTDFRAEYEGHVCDAEVGGTRTTINVNRRMDDALATIDRALASIEDVSSADIGLSVEDTSCSSSVLSDLRTAQTSTNAARTEADIDAALLRLEELQEKYSGLRCELLVNGVPETILVSTYLQEFVDALEERCSRELISAYEDFEDAKGVLDNYNGVFLDEKRMALTLVHRGDLEALRDAAESLQEAFPGQRCRARRTSLFGPDRTVVINVDSESEATVKRVNELLKEVEDLLGIE